MLCPVCGQIVNEEQPRFCPYCGASFDSLNEFLKTGQSVEKTAPLPKASEPVPLVTSQSSPGNQATLAPLPTESPKFQPYDFFCRYVGGHSAYPTTRDIRATLGENSITLNGLDPSRPFIISYSSITSIESKTQEEVSAGRMLLVGLWALAWKKKKIFMVLRFADEVGLSHDMVFDLESIQQVQPKIYERVVAHRKSAQSQT